MASPPGSTTPRIAAGPVFAPVELLLIGALITAHIILAILMRTLPVLATMHALASVVAGVVYALTTRRIRNVSIVVAYLAGCEVLWRMSKAAVFWEFGKYSIVAVLFAALLRMQWRRNRNLALLYVGLLLPSAALTFSTLGWDAARQDASFYLSGPLTLTVAVIFYSNIRLASKTLAATFIAFVVPVTAIGVLSFLSTRAQEALEFVNSANFATSGGFGPNQVSSMLGLAVMFLLLLLLTQKLRWKLRVPVFVLAAALATQSALTFSRGGVVLALAGIAASIFFLVQGSQRARAAVIVVGSLTFILGKYVIEPRLDAFTNGALSARYSTTDTSGRDVFVNSELEIFKAHPVLGVGPGIGMRLRAERGEFYGASHTEYSRMLAEHGALGLLALLCLIALGVRAIRNARDPRARALATAMIVWAALFLMVYGTRLAAPALVFGLAFVRAAQPPRSSSTAPVVA